MDDIEHMNDLGYVDRKLWGITVLQYQVDDWRKNFHQWYRKEVMKKPEERTGWNVSETKTNKDKNEASGQHSA